MRAKARDAGDAADGTASSRFAASSLRYDPSDPAPLAPEEIDHGRNQASGHVWPGNSEKSLPWDGSPARLRGVKRK